MRAPAFALGALGAILALTHLGLARERGAQAASPGATRAVVLAPLGYFLAQGLSAGAAVLDTRLYVAALTLHYVEYHVIMVPRLFHGTLDARRPVDQVAGLFRRHRFLFYALLLLVVVLFEARNHVPGSLDPGRGFIVHIFDGIFVLHYVLEAFLWKLGHPFYRETLAPLYFGPAQAGTARPPRRALSGSVAIGLGMLLLLFAATKLGAFHGLTHTVEQRVVARLDAEQHVRWGQTLMAKGAADEARAHFEHAAKRDPNSSTASSLLERLDSKPQTQEEPR
jgi:hypothetical protein